MLQYVAFSYYYYYYYMLLHATTILTWVEAIYILAYTGVGGGLGATWHWLPQITGFKARAQGPGLFGAKTALQEAVGNRRIRK